FVEGVTAGRGFLALAIVVFTRWTPLALLPASLLIGSATALQYRLQARGTTVPYAFFLALPPLLALAALAFARRSDAGTAAPKARKPRRPARRSSRSRRTSSARSRNICHWSAVRISRISRTMFACAFRRRRRACSAASRADETFFGSESFFARRSSRSSCRFS